MRRFSQIIIVVFTLLAASLLQGCKHHFPCDSELEKALSLAGENRQELESVLNHYTNDSLKLEAAKFLICNMPGHYSYADTAVVNGFYYSIDSMLYAMRDAPHIDIKKAIDSLYALRGADRFRIVEDVKYISADYLINNIETAFNQWQNIPWARHLDFDQFCEYLLPYKVNELQALDSWRTDFNSMFADSLERMSSCSLFRKSSYQATEVINHGLIKRFNPTVNEHDIPPLYYSPLTRLNVPFGNCDELSRAGLSIFRAAGVPCVIDYTPLWGYGNRGHSWAVVLAPNGKDIPFVPIFMSPTVQHKINETISKVYRYTYAINHDLQELNNSGGFVPETFRDMFQRDVTAQYANTRDLEIEVENSDIRYVYLCGTSRDRWNPVAVAKVEDGKAKFSDVGKGCIYSVAYYDSFGRQQFLNNPFIIDVDGAVRYIHPNLNKTQTATLYRKTPLLEYAWRMAVLMENGYFEASNNADFSNAVVVGKVTEPADRAGEIIIPDSIGIYRYWRYVKRGDDNKLAVGEIALYSDSINIAKTGAPISNITDFDSGTSPARAFDGKVLTHFSASKPFEAWIGVDFGKPRKIDKIQYTPRSDGDMIEPGHLYQLIYWNNGEWHVISEAVADSTHIFFDNIPMGALLILRNLTTNGSVRIFMLDEKGNQQWW
ncbi:MAG: discoidin domain-containing protein [Muribaculaceae bacterium]|nr:discoidin domain-containing protein [Muribaculaceae bacterium]